MTATADTGQSATVVFTSTGAVGNAYREIGEISQDGGKIEDSDLSTTVLKTYIPQDLAEAGEFEVEVEWNVDNPGPAVHTRDTATIKYPIKPGSSNTTKATCAGTGFFTKRVTPALKLGTLMTGKFMFAFDGKTGPSWTPESA